MEDVNARVVVAISSQAAKWALEARRDSSMLVVGPSAEHGGPAPDVAVAHGASELHAAVTADLAGRVDCALGVHVIGSDAVGSRTVEQVLEATGVPYLGVVPIGSPVTSSCAVIVEASTYSASFGQVLEAVTLLGLTDSIYTADVRLALQGHPSRVIVASTYLSFLGSGTPADALLDRGRSRDADFVLDAAALNAQVGLDLVRQVLETSDGEVPTADDLRMATIGVETVVGSAVGPSGVVSPIRLWEAPAAPKRPT